MDTLIKLFSNTFIVSKKDYESVQNEISESNRKTISMFSLFSTIVLVGMTVMTLLEDTMVMNRWCYLIGAVGSAIILLLTKFVAKENRKVTRICTYGFISILYMVAISMGTIIDPESVTVSYIVLLIGAPLAFTEYSRRINLITFIGMIVYTLLALKTQPKQVFEFNMYDVYLYGLLGMVICGIQMKAKIQRIILEKEKQHLIYSDQLTGFLNRRSFDDEIAKIKSGNRKFPISFFTFDVNGLKSFNDTLGHQAGDRLIIGSAECIKNVFGENCKCFRIGGDEFIVIAEGTVLDKSEQEEKLAAQTKAWSLENNLDLAISSGYAKITSPITVADSMYFADQEMYDKKRAFYEK